MPNNICNKIIPGISGVSGDAGLESGDLPEFGPEPEPSRVVVGVVGASFSSSVNSSSIICLPLPGLITKLFQVITNVEITSK